MDRAAYRTVSETAKRLGTVRQVVLKWIDEGRIKNVKREKFGRGFRYLVPFITTRPPPLISDRVRSGLQRALRVSRAATG